MTIKTRAIKARKQRLSFSCGPASLRTIFHFYGLSVSEQELIEKGQIQNDGTSHQMMSKLARMYNFKCYSKSNASVEDLEKWIKKGYPVIVNFQLGIPNGVNGHYAIIYGYDDKFFFLADPANYNEEDGKKFTENNKITRKKFIESWWDNDEKANETSKWYCLIRPK